MKGRRIANEIRYEKPLGDILSSQIRASLRVEQPVEPLTDKELACLAFSANGQTSADIGLKIGITTRTVNFHCAKILRKLNATNRQEAIAKAVSTNLLQPP
jgi:LuxR family transcriptional regulator, transcriptional regulator of spore coat protein